MDLTLTDSERAFRDKARQWLEANLPAPFEGSGTDAEGAAYFEHLRAWQGKLFEGGWIGLTWPEEYGGQGLTLMEQALFEEELARANAPEIPGIIDVGLVGPTIIVLGTEEQKKSYLPKILSGEEIWCQGFSEPNAGSDLASLGSVAVRDGDQFVINGQKTWTSFAHLAEQCFVLVRTDAEAPKHKGLTAFAVDMKSEGITTSPLRMMSGDSGFNEVFFTDVRVPEANVLGEVDGGWKVAITALMNERANLGGGVALRVKRDLEALVARAREIRRNGSPVSQDPIIRQRIAQAYLELEVFRTTATRALSRISRGGVPGPEGSILKIFWSEMNQRLAQIAMETTGVWGQLWDFDDGRWTYGYLRSRGNTIEAGTSEILRNVVAERVLGLPKSY